MSAFSEKSSLPNSNLDVNLCHLGEKCYSPLMDFMNANQQMLLLVQRSFSEGLGRDNKQEWSLHGHRLVTGHKKTT